MSAMAMYVTMLQSGAAEHDMDKTENEGRLKRVERKSQVLGP